MTDLSIHELSLGFAHDKQMLTDFLAKHHLNYEDDIEAAFGVFDADENLTGCGCCAGNLLKCFAVDESLRGQNALGSLVSRLVENRFAAGHYDLFVITRPNKKNGLDNFYKKFLAGTEDSDNIGCIVMNCNPFTKGHLALITYAARACDLLHIFVVEENRSQFPFADRLRLVREGTDHLANVIVHPSGPYMISNATFPTYFLKEGEDAAKIQSELDITLFASRIAPLLHIKKRFAGEEPFDPVTRNYNEAMIRILPRYGISFIKIDRITTEGPDGKPEVISASRVRKLLAEQGVTDEVLSLVPECTAKYLKEKFSAESTH